MAVKRVPKTKNPLLLAFMKNLFKAAAALLCALPLISLASTVLPISTVVVFPPDISQNSRIASDLQSRGINHATVYVNWSDTESREGLFDFSAYHLQFDPLVSDGLSLIVVLDMGGRTYSDHSGRVFPDRTTVPDWVRLKHPDGFMKNFSGDPTPQPNFADLAIRKLSARFLSQAVAHFSQRYPGKILGYAIGLQDEHEIKYGQKGYQWRDYSDATKADFQKLTGAQPPVINYNNNIAPGVPKAESLLYAHKQFRESRLKDATCFYANTIRANGGAAIGYFAETLTSHDAIYATGIVENLAECIDIAVIDFNFYDGYRLVPDSDVLPMLANYMASVGYQKIMVGAYAEIWERNGKTAELIPVINRTLSKALALPQVIGYEVGGMQRQIHPLKVAPMDLDKLEAISFKPAPRATERLPADARRIRIGILGSTTNFYVWHGERSGGTNPHRDALLEAYRILSNQPGFEVHVIGEKNLQEGNALLQSLDAILIPHQVALPQALKSRLAAFWKNGGTLIQDMRLGEFDENGKPTFDWMHEVFGIENVEWRNRGGIFLTADGTIHRLKPSRRYAGYASMAARPGYKILATELLDKQRGIMVRGDRTLVFGLAPQLVSDATQSQWHKLFVREIMNVVPTQVATSPSEQ